jgi:hypothetical protein
MSAVRPRPAALGGLLAVAATALLLAGCTDTSASDSSSTGTNAPASATEHSSSEHRTTEPAHPTTHPTHPTTVPPTSGHYDPSKCPPGLLCSSGS